MNLNAVMDEVIKNDKSKDDDETDIDDNGQKIDSSKVAITSEAATEIALKEATGTVTKLELESENGQTYYEMKIEDGTKEIDVGVDANSGAVLSVDKDDENDDDDDDSEE